MDKEPAGVRGTRRGGCADPHPHVAAELAGAFACFCALSSATYLINDVHDRHEDARHPRRRERPIAAGEVSVRLALRTAAALALCGLGGAFAIRPLLGVTGAGYLALTAAYSLWLRRVAVADIAIVAAGFVLCALAGGAATGVPVSRWFVMVASFGALFLVAGKRSAELGDGEHDTVTRSTLTTYSKDYLRFRDDPRRLGDDRDVLSVGVPGTRQRWPSDAAVCERARRSSPKPTMPLTRQLATSEYRLT